MSKKEKELNLNAQPLYDGSILEEGNVVVSVVLTKELKEMLRLKGMNVSDMTRMETMPNGKKVPVIYMQCKPDGVETMKKFHNNEVNKYLDKDGYKDSIYYGTKRYISNDVLEEFYGVAAENKEDKNGVVHFDEKGRAYIYDSTLSYDKMVDDLNKSNVKGYEPSAGIGELHTSMCVMALKALIDEVCNLNPRCGEILKMLYSGLELKEIVQQLGVKKSQAYDLIKKAQALACSLRAKHGL